MTEAEHIDRLLEAGRRAVDPKHRRDPGEVGLRKGWMPGETETASRLSQEAAGGAGDVVSAMSGRREPQRAS